MSDKHSGSNQENAERRGSPGDDVNTSSFEQDLKATLDWLTEGPALDPGFEDCPQTQSVLLHARGDQQPNLAEHLDNCPRCRDLASYLRRRDNVYQRQREYFLKQVEWEHRRKPWRSSLGEVLRQTFRPFDFLAQKTALVAMAAVLLVITLGVWELPTLVATFRTLPPGHSFDARIALASRKVELDYGRIQNTSAADPVAAAQVLGELRDATQKGGVVPVEKMNAVLASMQTKKDEAPDKSKEWGHIENQLQVYALLNNYTLLHSEKRTGAPLWKDLRGVSKEDGNAVIFLNHDSVYDPETYRILEESRRLTEGINTVTLVTPSNKKVAMPQSAESQWSGASASVVGASQSKGSSVAIENTGYGETKNSDLVKNASAEYGARPVKILDEPVPQYTDEAKALKLEGDVVLDVVFLANSKVEVIRVVSALGHGLDERATQAAQSIRFEPAQTAGRPVDFPARVRIEFRLAD
jgi:TonB family protein